MLVLTRKRGERVLVYLGPWLLLTIMVWKRKRGGFNVTSLAFQGPPWLRIMREELGPHHEPVTEDHVAAVVEMGSYNPQQLATAMNDAATDTGWSIYWDGHRFTIQEKP